MNTRGAPKEDAKDTILPRPRDASNKVNPPRGDNSLENWQQQDPSHKWSAAHISAQPYFRVPQPLVVAKPSSQYPK